MLDCVFVRTQRTHGHTATGTGQNEGVPFDGFLCALARVARKKFLDGGTGATASASGGDGEGKALAAALKRLNEGYVFPRAGYLEPEPVPLDLVRPSVLALFREQEPFLQASVLVGSVSLR